MFLLFGNRLQELVVAESESLLLWCFSESVAGFEIEVYPEQELDDLLAAVAGGVVQGRVAPAVLAGLHPGPVQLVQRLHNRQVVVALDSLQQLPLGLRQLRPRALLGAHLLQRALEALDDLPLVAAARYVPEVLEVQVHALVLPLVQLEIGTQGRPVRDAPQDHLLQLGLDQVVACE
jgi:hypothetical protein